MDAPTAKRREAPPFAVEPRDYQLDAIPMIRQAYKEGKRRVVFCAPTGAGKSVIAYMFAHLSLHKGSRAAFLTNRISLIRQTQRLFAKHGMTASVLWAGAKKEFSPSAQLQLVAVDTLRARAKVEGFMDSFPKVDVAFVDECFVAGTMVDTPSGQVKIEDIKTGDCVLNAFGRGIVLAARKKKSNDLYLMEFEDGTRFTCTGNHPILSSDGFIEAAKMGVGSVAYRKQDLRSMQEHFYSAQSCAATWSLKDSKRGSLEQAESLLKLLQNRSKVAKNGRLIGESFPYSWAKELVVRCEERLSILWAYLWARARHISE